MREKEIVYEGLKIRICQATVLMGARRARLIYEGLQSEDDDADRLYLRRNEYPDIMAATLEVQGMDWPLSFDEFIELDACILEESGWLESVRELNPHWYKTKTASDSKKKSDQQNSTDD